LLGADLGIGVMRAGEPPPWGADLLAGEDLNVVRFILRASSRAREVSKQSVNVALGSATLGALVAAGGMAPMSPRSVITIVNGASIVSMMNGLRASTTLDRTALPPPRDRTPWHALDPQGVLHRLASSESGLLRSEIIRRLPTTPRPRGAAVELFEAVTDELFNPLAPLLAAGAGLSAVVGSMSDASMVAGVVVLNALVGGVQRYATERAIRDLSRVAQHRAIVRRAGHLEEVDARELVVGDVIELESGHVVPADCRILEAVSLEVDASSLTGESLPVRKTAEPSFAASIADRTSMLFEGTSIVAGRATAVVVAVGDATEARRAVIGAPRSAYESGVDQRLRSLINLTGPLALASGTGLVGLGLLRGRKLQDLIGSGVSLAVASVPEGLPLLATAAQLASAKRLSRRGALVRNPRSIEALGRVQVLCIDKTGTLTEGRLELRAVSDGTLEEGLDVLRPERISILAAALRATPAERREEGGEDPVDAAVLRGTKRLGVAQDRDFAAYRRDAELAYESGRSYHASLGGFEGGRLLSVKGAPELVLRACTHWQRGSDISALDTVSLQQLEVLAALLGRRGLRVLGVAERVVDAASAVSVEDPLAELCFKGFVAFSDPVRSTARVALDRLVRAGVRPVMLTGDHPSTARAIAAEIGYLSGEVLSGADLLALSDEELDARLERVSVFARVAPSQKVRVVRALQRVGRVVAMVGDGANDAPAIRRADVGIALGERSTSAARGAADVVIVDERIETVVDALVEGRAMWASVRDAVSILVGGNLGEIAFTLAGGLVDGKPPLNPRQLLLVNLLTDVAPAMAIALRPTSDANLENLANEGPEASLGEPLNRDIASRAVVTAAGAGLAWTAGRLLTNEERARTIALLALVGTQLGQTIVSGGTSRAVLGTSAASALALGALVQTPGVSGFFGCRPLGPVGWGIAAGSSAVATAASVFVPKAVTRLATSLKLDEVMNVAEVAGELAPASTVILDRED
jgi:cation-transporting ATPase I